MIPTNLASEFIVLRILILEKKLTVWQFFKNYCPDYIQSPFKNYMTPIFQNTDFKY